MIIFCFYKVQTTLKLFLVIFFNKTHTIKIFFFNFYFQIL